MAPPSTAAVTRRTPFGDFDSAGYLARTSDLLRVPADRHQRLRPLDSVAEGLRLLVEWAHRATGAWKRHL